MSALNFQKQFAPKIISGDKTHTIRKRRKHPIQAGHMLQLYIGLRTKQAQKLAERRCLKVEPIIIDPTRSAVIVGDDVSLGDEDQLRLAQADGFKNRNDFFEFFSSRYSLDELKNEMVLIHWMKP